MTERRLLDLIEHPIYKDKIGIRAILSAIETKNEHAMELYERQLTPVPDSLEKIWDDKKVVALNDPGVFAIPGLRDERGIPFFIVRRQLAPNEERGDPLVRNSVRVTDEDKISEPIFYVIYANCHFPDIERIILLVNANMRIHKFLMGKRPEPCKHIAVPCEILCLLNSVLRYGHPRCDDGRDSFHRHLDKYSEYREKLGTLGVVQGLFFQDPKPTNQQQYVKALDKHVIKTFIDDMRNIVLPKIFKHRVPRLFTLAARTLDSQLEELMKEYRECASVSHVLERAHNIRIYYS